jgi:hypothetical protein
VTEPYAIEYTDIANKIACSWHDYNVVNIVEEIELCKIEVRHILFKKIRSLIFLNNQAIAYCTVTYCLKRKS